MKRLPGGGAERRIADYALIGDGRTAALVGRDGAIDWLCLPQFDAEACFAALLGGPDNGCWRIAPRARAKVTRRYRDDTLVLETEFETRTGTVALLDFMATDSEEPVLVRIVEGRRGTVAMQQGLALRFDYGRIHPRVELSSPGRVLAVVGPHAVAVASDVPLVERERNLESRFTVKAGERLCFTLAWGPSHRTERPPAPDAYAALQATLAWWRNWIAGSRYDGPLKPHVRRSLLTLKALIYRPTGAILAAPTASLPERLGGDRNWDYRFCWLRDATFTLMALIHAGLDAEADAWVGWLRRAVAGEPADLQPFYTLDAARRAPEWEADWLAGFAGSQPVRFGNAAVEQFQLDIYGEVIDALWVAHRHGIGDGDDLFALLADRLAEIWERPDAGIWESRGEPRQHTYSKVMCWVGFDRAARWFEPRDPRRAARFSRLARRVKALVLKRGYDRRRKTFVRAFDDRALDAAALRLPLVGFLPADDPRVKGTVKAVEQRLMRDGLVMRYETRLTDDGVGGEEGAFVAASFWLADVYALQGRIAEARALFHRVCGRANDLDLLSEELGPGGEFFGNFPQGLSHLALVSAGLNLTERGGPAHERAKPVR